MSSDGEPELSGPDTPATCGPIRIERVRAQVYRAPLETPVITSFGEMRDRPMVLIAITNEDGITGWGEVWCNFPTVGAEHRARLVESVFVPLLEGQTFESPQAAFDFVTGRTEVLAIQSGEAGPIAQCIAGLDMANWDIAGQQAGLPLWKLFGAKNDTVGVYASGLNPQDPETLAASKAEDGFAAFKLKVGFGPDRDLSNLKTLRKTLGEDAKLMVDVNQGWTLGAAIEQVPRLAEFGLDWIEEPVRADTSWDDWRRLNAVSPAPLAGGENIAGDGAFDEAMTQRVFGVVQPDLAKWGGISKCLPLARRILEAGARYCPHFLGGGIGLLASAHVLAAAGGDGLLEIDANPNPLRSLLCGPLEDVSGGRVALPAGAGLGAEFENAELEQYRVR